MTNLNLQDATGRWTMEEIPNSEKVFKADLVIIAAGFLGPEKTLAEQFGLKKVRPLCFCPQLCCLLGFLGISV